MLLADALRPLNFNGEIERRKFRGHLIVPSRSLTYKIPASTRQGFSVMNSENDRDSLYNQLSQMDKLSNEELFKNLANSLRSRRIGMSPEKTEDGSDIFKNYKKAFRKIICEHQIVQEMIRSEKSYTRIQIAAAIVDVIAGYLTGVAALVVCTMIVREGVGSLCEESFQSDQKS